MIQQTGQLAACGKFGLLIFILAYKSINLKRKRYLKRKLSIFLHRFGMTNMWLNYQKVLTCGSDSSNIGDSCVRQGNVHLNIVSLSYYEGTTSANSCFRNPCYIHIC